ncbi:MAG TPA: FKBP-type peptidyl-prolyl cis-trans isomerase [bacterium]|nr:FKBP-type peptidyl-prolyl cis-trans isomerase [bacterium]
MAAPPRRSLKARRQAALRQQTWAITLLLASAMGLAAAVPLRRASQPSVLPVPGGPGIPSLPQPAVSQSMAHALRQAYPAPGQLGGSRSITHFSNQWSAAEESMARRLADGLMTTDVVVGTGPTLEPGKTGVFRYRGWLTDGTLVAANVGTGLEARIPGPAMDGWDRGLLGMKVGGTRKLYVPSPLGYGAQGAPPTVPPGADLVFEVTLEKVK